METAVLPFHLSCCPVIALSFFFYWIYSCIYNQSYFFLRKAFLVLMTMTWMRLFTCSPSQSLLRIQVGGISPPLYMLFASVLDELVGQGLSCIKQPGTVFVLILALSFSSQFLCSETPGEYFYHIQGFKNRFSPYTCSFSWKFPPCMNPGLCS